jgi:predicted alpha/beta-hydrolase family hydrolase
VRRYILTMDTLREFVDTSAGVAVRGFLHQSATGGPNRPFDRPIDCLILTHGAGANCNAPLLVALAEAFSASGLAVLRCDLPFRQSRPHGPPPRGSAERDQQGLRAAVESMRRHFPGHMYLGGHSYGGRQASMLAAAQPGLVERLLLLSYPLHPPQRPTELRTAHFPNLQTPALFVLGVKDGFASVQEITEALKLIPAKTELLTVAGSGHELMTKRNRDRLPTQLVQAFESF